MTSGAHTGRIPYSQHNQHSTTARRQGPRFATSSLRAPHVPDVRSAERRPSTSTLAPHQTCAADSPYDKVDSKSISAGSSLKDRAHSRLASFGRIRPRGSVQYQQRAPLGVAKPTPVPPSPSDTGSYNRSNTSTLSNSSSDTTLSDDAKSDTKVVDDRRPSFWLSALKVPTESVKDLEDSIYEEEQPHERLGHLRSRMMHQTSSKLLRMTEDERPFTRVCYASYELVRRPLHTPPCITLTCMVSSSSNVSNDGASHCYISTTISP